MSTILTLMLAAAAAGQQEQTDKAQADEDKAAASARLDYMKRSAAVYRINLGDHDKTLIKLIEEPVLRWTNPVSNIPDGALFLWVGPNGRPEVAAQVFIAAQTKDLWLHEFQSLSNGTFSVARGNDVPWHPQKPGIEFKPVEETPAPAESAVQRLTQMRSIAQKFQADDDFEGKSRWELRLMAKPLQRYGKPDSEILDGALFAFVHRSEPEVFVMIEARGTPGKYRWQ